MKRILVSACLLGLNTKYDGTNNFNNKVAKLLKRSDVVIIPFCPEQLGGLPTPREPADLTGDGAKVLNGEARVITRSGLDVTEYYIRGAQESVKLARLCRIDIIILKSRSPSCGINGVYKAKDLKLMPWNGVTAALLRKEDFTIISDEEIDKADL
jgi:uncharacterized protein YbbK (DUF523 family)